MAEFESVTLVPFRQVAANLDMSERTLKKLLARHNVRIVQLTPSKRAITMADYTRLLHECRQAEVAA